MLPTSPDAPDMILLNESRRPAPAFPLHLFSEAWATWLTDTAEGCRGSGGLRCIDPDHRRELAHREQHVGVALAGMVHTAAALVGPSRTTEFGQDPCTAVPMQKVHGRTGRGTRPESLERIARVRNRELYRRR